MNAYTSCATCVERGEKGYCAPLRCYCGHEACDAFSSYYEMTYSDAPPVSPVALAGADVDPFGGDE